MATLPANNIPESDHFREYLREIIAKVEKILGREFLDLSIDLKNQLGKSHATVPLKPVFRIRVPVRFIRIRIQVFSQSGSGSRLIFNSDPDPDKTHIFSKAITKLL